MTVDTSLMLTIAEVSATFVAIVSGLYTSKIISLSSDRQRIRNKIREIDAELKPREDTVKDYEGRLRDHNKEIAKDIVESFEKRLFSRPFLRQYNSLEELFMRFQELTSQEPDELEREVMGERLQSINESIRKELKERKSSPKRSVTKSAITSTLQEDVQRNAQYNELISKRDDERAQIRILSSSRKNYEQELESGSFPRHITFGYVSQVAFAIVGVVFPLTYGSWSNYAGDYSNLLAIGLFGAGLATTFGYIISEVWAAVHEKKV